MSIADGHGRDIDRYALAFVDGILAKSRPGGGLGRASHNEGSNPKTPPREQLYEFSRIEVDEAPPLQRAIALEGEEGKARGGLFHHLAWLKVNLDFGIFDLYIS